jgi:hypothetical protein
MRLMIMTGAVMVLALGPLAGPSGAQPLQLPGAGASTPQGGVAPPPPDSGRPPAGFPGQQRQAAPPVQSVPETAIVGQALLQNGRAGRFVMERLRGGFGLKFNVEGFQTNNPTEPCAVSFGEEAVPLEALGRPMGLARFRLQSPVCPVVFDVLNNALLVSEPAAPCVIEAAQCRIDPRGLWGPDGRGLTALAREIERDRVRAEAQVREGFRLLGERVPPDERRMVAREQAGFSSEREQICRDFAREGTHGFCAAKVTEARAASLRSRLQPEQPQRAGQPRRP